MNTPINLLNAPSGKYLTFKLASEHFSLPVLKVREIMRLTPITPVPRMPPYIKGVLNLRGKLSPSLICASVFLWKACYCMNLTGVASSWRNTKA